MNIFPYEVKDHLYTLRKQYPPVSFAIPNPQTFENSTPIEVIEACKMVGIYGTKSDIQKFIDEDQPDWIMKKSKRRWIIPETLFTS